MLGQVRSFFQIFRQNGYEQAIWETTRWVWNNVVYSRVPRRRLVYNSVVVESGTILDRFVPFGPPGLVGDYAREDWEGYESGLLTAIRETVQTGDTAVLIGAGYGPSSVVCDRYADSTIAYEALPDIAREGRRTLSVNHSDAEIRTGTIGSVVGGYGSGSPSEAISAEQLPECDVLIMDCEGAEVEILDDLTEKHAPERLIVETHGNEEAVREKLTTHGLDIQNRVVAEPDLIPLGIAEDVYVLTATV